MIDLNSILQDFIKPEVKPSLIKKLTGRNEVRRELEKRREIMIATKDLLKSSMWKQVMEPRIVDSIKSGLGKVWRATPQNTTVEELWTIIANMKAHLGTIADLKYKIQSGEAAARKLVKQ